MAKVKPELCHGLLVLQPLPGDQEVNPESPFFKRFREIHDQRAARFRARKQGFQDREDTGWVPPNEQDVGAILARAGVKYTAK